MDPRQLAGDLRAARLAARLTQLELAMRMGTTQTAIARAESGRIYPTLPLLAKWASATGQAIQLLFEAGDLSGPDIAPSGVDRDQLRYQLSLTPQARLAGLRNAARLRSRSPTGHR